MLLAFALGPTLGCPRNVSLKISASDVDCFSSAKCESCARGKLRLRDGVIDLQVEFAMERTDDFFRIVELYKTEKSTDQNSQRKSEIRPSQYLNLAQRVAATVDSNEALVCRMDKLSARKEFSNDPTIEMTEISDLFHRKVAIIQREFASLKAMTDGRQQQNGQQQMQHYKLMMQVLNKRHTGHIESFKKALKTHSEHVQQRQKRVGKYGQGLDQIRAGAAGKIGTDMSLNSYAMFSSPIIHQNNNRNMAEVQKSQELRRRLGPGSLPSESNEEGVVGAGNSNLRTSLNNGNSRGQYAGASSSSSNNNYNIQKGKVNGRSMGSGTGSGSGSGNYYQQMQIQKSADKIDSTTRMQGAEKVEKAISQMGQLFSQMATLVLEQSETLARIEDDVEIGLSDTKEAHQSMENLYEITKGNRSMIIKIFLLLIFFIFLFLVWT